MSWEAILKDTRSKLKEMFSQDEDIVERYDSSPDEAKEMIDTLIRRLEHNRGQWAIKPGSYGSNRILNTKKTISSILGLAD
tara:strand:- start:6778 stop:7020 length:243 start_codon:yes stop_codon:yes gene_type:complete